MKNSTFDSITTKASNIKVIARFRPSPTQQQQKINSENVASKSSIVEFPSPASCTLPDKGLTFTFDRVFSPTTTQAELFDTSLSSTVTDLMKGYNGTVLAYGQTGSGKTHTMLGQTGSEQQRGVIPRIVDMIFAAITNGSEEVEYTVKVSYMEIYLEKIRDLLQSPPPRQGQAPDTVKSLPIHEDRTRGVYVKGLTEEYVSSRTEIEQLMEKGSRARVVGKTRMNSESSRSHAIFTISVGQKNLATNNMRTGKLSLVDLAGSEKVDKTGVVGQSLQEAKKINQSLSALGLVINALASRAAAQSSSPAAASPTIGQPHIPYRDSKLTRILQESLGGNSRTTLIINCSCDAYNATETLSTLRFGERAKGIQNKAKINTELSAIELRQIVHDLKRDLKKRDGYARQLETELVRWRTGEQVNKREWVDVKATSAAELSLSTPVTPNGAGELLTPPATPRAKTAAFQRGHRHSLSYQPNTTLLDQVGVKPPSSKRSSFQPDEGLAVAATALCRQPSPAETVSMSTDTEDTDAEDRLQELLGRENALQDQLAEQETVIAAQALQINELTSALSSTNTSNGPDQRQKQEQQLDAERRLTELQTQFDEMKSALMSDIRDRCQRVVELEIELDLLQDKNRSLQRASTAVGGGTATGLGASIGLGGGTTASSGTSGVNINTAAQYQDKIRALQKDLEMATKILDLKNDRIMELELQAQSYNSQSSQQMYGAPVYTRDGQAFLYNDIPPAPAPVAHAPKIVKPLRGGGGFGNVEAYNGGSTTMVSVPTLAHGRGHTRNNSIWNKINAIVNPSF